jgi:hypothetical protein
LDAFEGVCSDLLSLYGEVFILGDFNVDLPDLGHVLFEPFSDLLEIFMLHNFAILPTRRVSGKLLDLFLMSVPAGVNDFYQMTVPWSDHDVLFLSCRLERPREVAEFYSIRGFRDVDQSELVAAWLMVDLFYSMLFYLMYTFAPKRLVRAGDDMSGVHNWLDDRVELAIRLRNDSYDIWSGNVNRVRGDCLWVDYIAKCQHADALVERN